jgi:hypothetical protein
MDCVFLCIIEKWDWEFNCMNGSFDVRNMFIRVIKQWVKCQFETN